MQIALGQYPKEKLAVKGTGPVSSRTRWAPHRRLFPWRESRGQDYDLLVAEYGGAFALRIASGLAAVLLLACAGKDSGRNLNVQPDWRLIPEATVLNQDRQFFLYGRRLDSVTVTVPPGVSMDKGELSQGGRVLSLHSRVAPLGKDSLAAGESVGLREVRIKTLDTALVFGLKIFDEALPR